MSSPNTTRYSPLGPASMYSNHSLFAKALDLLFRYPSGTEGCAFRFNEDLRMEAEVNKDKTFVSFCINNTDYQYPVGISNSDLYHNIIEYLENTYGYKTGRYMEIYQGNGAKYGKDSSLNNNILREYPNIAFLRVFYNDYFRYKFFYEKNKRIYSDRKSVV